MNHIEAHFRVRFGNFALDAAFTAPGRGITALFGPSGSGKTTLLRCIGGLTRAVEGRLHVNGESWQDEASGHFLPAHRRAIGYVFQEASLFPHLSVRGNLEYGFKRVPMNERRVVFEQAAELLGVGPLLERWPEHLSGGERQRVAIARALLASPRLLLMDEPLSALDEASKADILPYLERLHRELSVPALYVSHSLDEVARVADYMVLLEQGAVRTHGSLDALLTRLDLALARGETAGAVIEAALAEHDAAFHLTYFDFSGGRLAVTRTNAPIGSRRRVRIQARDVSLALSPSQRTSILNILPARVIEIVEDAPGRVIVRLAVGDAILLARVTRKSASLLGLAPDTPVYAHIKSVALMD